MPLVPEYGEEIKSKVADLKNVGGRLGSSITAAMFLKEFVKKVRRGRGVSDHLLADCFVLPESLAVHDKRSWVEDRRAEQANKPMK